VADIPAPVSDEETIVRGICSPYHLKKGKLKPHAFDPTKDTDETSVMRHDFLGSDFCKAKAKELANPLANPKKIYEGFAVLSARQIRLTSCEVKDSREVYPGHADIKLGVGVQSGEPPPAEQLPLIQERRKDLAKRANYFPDPDPDSATWTGAALVPKPGTGL
jgi:hypothetical protein